MEYRLGLDLGTSSLGWCCVETKNGDNSNVLDIGVRIFPDGRNDKTKEPLAVARRAARCARRRLGRFKLRQKNLITDLQKYGFLPQDKDEYKKLEKENPYKLRSDAVNNKISLYELGRVILHLNQRRGFLSNRKEEKNIQTSTKTQKAINNLTLRIEEAGCKTLGEYLYRTSKYRFKNKTDANGNMVVNDDTLYPTREMYQKEFDYIWNFQQKNYPELMSDEIKKRFRDYDIFFQRKLKKQETGFCRLEPEERRCPKAFVTAQIFRITQDIENMRINYPESRILSKNEKSALYEFLNNPPKNSADKNYRISYDIIIKHLGLPSETIFNFVNANKDGMLCNITNVIMSDEKAYSDVWHTYTAQQQNKIVEILQDYGKDSHEIIADLKALTPDITAEQIKNILQLSLLLPEGYMDLSEKAMDKLATEMRLCGVTYDKAVESVYNKSVEERQYFDEEKYLPHYQELFSEQLIGGDKENFDKTIDYDNYMGRITNVSVHIALNQLRQVVNSLISKYGKPEGITIELGRELTCGKKAQNDIKKRQNENAKIMAEARTALREKNIPLTAFNVEKYKVWRNLNPKDASKRFDLYTGKNISLNDLFSWNYEIEHILPYSWTYDDSYNNKIITRADVNRKKLNQLPYVFFSDKEQLKSIATDSEELENMTLEKVVARAKDIDKARGNIKKTFNFNAIAWRFSSNAENIFNKNNKNMARDLTDMQYMSRLAKKYLTCICDYTKIVSAKGQMTDQMKKVWNLNDIMPKDYYLWCAQKWQTDDIEEWKTKQNLQENPEQTENEAKTAAKHFIDGLSEAEIHNLTKVGKDRSIHYHHALDAFILANITPSVVQYLSSNDFADKAEHYQKTCNFKADADKYITLNEARISLLKQSGKFYESPYTGFDKTKFADMLRNITVSYKNPADKLKLLLKKAELTGKNCSQFGFAAINEDTAFGFRRVLKVSQNDMDLEFAVRKNSIRVYETHSLSTMVPVFRTKEQKAEFLRLYPEWLKSKVRKKSIGKEKCAEIEQKFIDSFNKDKAYKWYASAGNYAAQIYQIRNDDKFVPNKNGKWSLEILPNFYAFERKGKFFWKDVYPTAKLVTTLHIDDVVEATFSAEDDLSDGFSKIQKWIKEQFRLHPEQQELKLLFRVKKMSGGSIFLRPLHIAQEDRDEKSWKCSVGKFQQYQCRKVTVNPLGNIIGG